MDDLDKLFEEAAAECAAQNAALEADPLFQARKKAQKEREIAQGLRDSDGFWILSDDEDGELEEDDDDDDEEE